MALLDQIQHPWLTWAGLVLTHSLWQGAAVGLFVAIFLAVIPRRLAGLRAHGCHLAILAMLLAPVLTMSVIEPPATTWHVATPSQASTSAENILPVQPTTTTAHLPINEPQLPATHSNIAAGETSLLGEASSPVLSSESMFTATDQPTNAAATQPSRREWQSAALASMAIVWVCGVTLLTLRLLIGWSRIRRLRQRATALTEPLEQAAARMLERFELLGRAVVMTTLDVASPVAFGLFRPVVLVPASLISRCPVEHIEALIAHELAHIRRHDLWFALIQRVVETLFFYHPVVWWISGRTSVERELCCDDLAISTTGQRTVYATALLEASKEVLAAVRPVLTAGIFGSRVTLAERVRRALQLPTQSQNNHSWLVVPLCLVMAGALLLAAHVQANDKTRPEKTPSVADATESTEEADPPTEETEFEEPDPVPLMPTTELIPTEFSGLNQELDARRYVLGTIEPAVQAGRAVHAMREALFDNDLAKLQRCFRPSGQTVTQEQMDSLQRDLHTMQLDDYGSSWKIATVNVAPDLGLGLVTCTGGLFEPETNGKPGRSTFPDQLLVLMSEVTRDVNEDRWYVTQLKIVSEDDDHSTQEEFFHSLKRHHTEDNPVELSIVDFTTSGIVMNHVQRVSQTESDGEITWKLLFDSKNMRRRGQDVLSGRRFFVNKRIPFPVQSQLEGMLARVMVSEGQDVDKGDILVELENREINLQLQAARIRLEKLQRALDTINSIPDTGATIEKANLESDLELAKIDVKLWELRLESTQIRSPIAGKISSLSDCLSRRRVKIEKGTTVAYVIPRSQ